LIDGATGALSDKTKANLAMIMGSGKRLSTLINDIRYDFLDQLGGQKRFPFGNKRFRKRLMENNQYPFDEQYDKMLEAFNSMLEMTNILINL